MPKARRVGIALFLGIYMLSGSGCAVKVPLSPDIPNLQFGKKLPVEAALLITEETRNYIFTGRSDSLTGRGTSYELAFGETLEKTSIEIFSQIFDKITVVRTQEEAKKYTIYVEPKIEDFHFWFATDIIPIYGAIIVSSRIKVHIRAGRRDVSIKEESVESPEYQSKPGVFKAEKDLGGTASAALVYTLGKIAIQLSEDASFRQFIENK
jgi:hypothetical protein